MVRVATVLWCAALYIAVAPPPKGWKEPFQTPADVYNVWFDSRESVDQEISKINFQKPGDLHAMDAFSGVANIQRAYHEQGLQCESYDRWATDEYNPKEDILTKDGFWTLMALCCRVIRFGVIHWGPPCGMWVFWTISIHARSRLAPWGNHKRKLVSWDA